MPSSTALHSVTLPQSAPAMDGELDAFQQDDWEFELDTLPTRSREALAAHLAKATDSANPETVAFLRSHLMESDGVTFTPFTDD